jgi:hypothetical protein
VRAPSSQTHQEWLTLPQLCYLQVATRPRALHAAPPPRAAAPRRSWSFARWLPVHLHRARAALSRTGELTAASAATVCEEIARALVLTRSFSGARYLPVRDTCEHARCGLRVDQGSRDRRPRGARPADGQSADGRLTRRTQASAARSRSCPRESARSRPDGSRMTTYSSRASCRCRPAILR